MRSRPLRLVEMCSKQASVQFPYFVIACLVIVLACSLLWGVGRARIASQELVFMPAAEVRTIAAAPERMKTMAHPRPTSHTDCGRSL